MPKDYRDRRIDDKPPRVTTKHVKRTTTAGDPDSGGGEDLVLPPETPTVATANVQPGDGVLWFLRVPVGGSAPSGRNVELQTTGGGAVTFSYVASPSGWSDYITSFAGDYTLQSDGVTVLQNDTIYVIWDQFTGFTGGNYKFSFTVAAGATIAKAIKLRGVSTSAPGTFYSGMSQGTTWSVTYDGDPPPDDVVNNFPRTLTFSGGALARRVYGIWQMSGGVQAPAALYSADGVALLSYTYSNPADQPYFKQSIVTYMGDTLPTTTSFEIVAPFENGWGGAI
jgi:hypothetical protein